MSLYRNPVWILAWLSLCFILERSWVALYSDVCQSVCQASVSPDQISFFSNIYRHTSPLLTMYHLIPSSTNLYWPSTSQYRHILTQYHQVPLIIHHLVRHSSVNWIISLFTTHLKSHVQYTWSSFLFPSPPSLYISSKNKKTSPKIRTKRRHEKNEDWEPH